MADNRVNVKVTGLDYMVRGWQDSRGAPGGGGISLPWVQSLVFEGHVFGFHAGDVTTGIAGHAAVDADQPEIALRVPDGTEVLPLFLRAEIESGATTLGIHGVMYSVSNIDVANGTSTAFNTDGKPINMRLDNPYGSACIGRHTYSANGTDPLTTGNFIELGRVSGLIDSDATSANTLFTPLELSVLHMVMPVVKDAGSVVGYGEGGTQANFFFKIMFVENQEGWLSS